MIDPGGVAYSARGPALTTWGKAAVLAAALLYFVNQPGSDTGVSIVVVAAIGVACLVDGAFAIFGFRARVLGITVPAKVHLGDEVAARVRLDGNPDLLATIPGYVAVHPAAVDQHGVAVVRASLSRRCVHVQFVLQLLRPGPLGLVEATQRIVVPLPRPLLVLPPPGPAVVPDQGAAEVDLSPDAGSPFGPGAGAIEQLREHQPGDDLRSVNWPATARRGALVVAERDRPMPARTHVVVDVGRGWPDGDAVVARALTVVGRILARGDEVVLTGRTSVGALTRAPRSPYFSSRLDLVPAEVETIVTRSLRDAEVLLAGVVGGPVPDQGGPAYVLSPSGDRWVGGHGA